MARSCSWMTLLLPLVGLTAMLGRNGSVTAAAQASPALTVACAPNAGEMLQPVENWAFTATGGTPPYTFGYGSDVRLPDGLSLAPNGRITGTPNGLSGGRRLYKAKVTDSRGTEAVTDCEITMAAPPGWQVRICRNLLESGVTVVRLRIGIGGLDTSHQEWTTWMAHESVIPAPIRPLSRTVDDLITVPTEFRYVRELWVQATPQIWVNGSRVDDHKNATMCVLWNHNVTKATEFDDTDDNEVSREDHDNCGC
jgi:putative Ig domain-containing protein